MSLVVFISSFISIGLLINLITIVIYLLKGSTLKQSIRKAFKK